MSHNFLAFLKFLKCQDVAFMVVVDIAVVVVVVVIVIVAIVQDVVLVLVCDVVFDVVVDVVIGNASAIFDVVCVYVVATLFCLCCLSLFYLILSSIVNKCSR